MRNDENPRGYNNQDSDGSTGVNNADDIDKAHQSPEEAFQDEDEEEESRRGCLSTLLKKLHEFFNADIGPTDAGIIAYYDLRHFNLAGVDLAHGEHKNGDMGRDQERAQQQEQQRPFGEDSRNQPIEEEDQQESSVLGSTTSITNKTKATENLQIENFYNILGGHRISKSAIMNEAGGGNSMHSNNLIQSSKNVMKSKSKLVPVLNVEDVDAIEPETIEEKKKALAQLKNLLNNPKAFSEDVAMMGPYPRAKRLNEALPDSVSADEISTILSDDSVADHIDDSKTDHDDDNDDDSNDTEAILRKHLSKGSLKSRPSSHHRHQHHHQSSSSIHHLSQTQLQQAAANNAAELAVAISQSNIKLSKTTRKSLEMLAKGNLEDNEPDLLPPLPPELSFEKSRIVSDDDIDSDDHNDDDDDDDGKFGKKQYHEFDQDSTDRKSDRSSIHSHTSDRSSSRSSSSSSGKMNNNDKNNEDTYSDDQYPSSDQRNHYHQHQVTIREGSAKSHHTAAGFGGHRLEDVEGAIRDHLNHLMVRTKKMRTRRDQEKARQFMFHPRSRFMFMWTMLLLTLILIDFVLIPIIVAFPLADGIPYLYFLSYIIDGIFLFDMVLKFRTSIHYKTHVIDHPRDIAAIYRRNGLITDILSLFPFDVAAFFFAMIYTGNSGSIVDPLTNTTWSTSSNFTTDNSTINQFYMTVSSQDAYSSFLLPWLRLNRLLRITRVFIYLNNQEIDLAVDTGYIRIKRYLLVILILIHGGACTWYLLACRVNPVTREAFCSSDSWIAQGADGTVNILYQKSYLSVYIECLYYIVISVTAVGYGDITPRTSLEKLFAIFIVLYGVLLFGFIMGNVASSVSTRETSRAEFQRKFNAIREYMKAQKLPKELQMRVTAYYAHEWNFNKGMEKELYESLPPAFRGEVALAVNRATLEKVPFLRGCGDEVLRELALLMKPITVLPQDLVIRRGTVGEEMFFIHGGSMEVITKDGTAVAELGPGAFFGELALLFKTPRTASVRAVTHCDVFSLSERDLHSVIQNHPDIQRRIKAIAEERFEWYMGQRYVDTGDEFHGKLERVMRKEALKKVPLFKTCNRAFLDDLSTTMRSIVYQPGDTIIQYGAIGSEMFFIHRGVVLVTSPDGSRVYAELGPGAYFGEVSLVYNVPRTAGVRAKTVCDLYVLFQSSFQKMLRENQEVAEIIREDAQKRYSFIQAQIIQ